MNEEILSQIGLTKEQSNVYSLLLEKGFMSAGKLSTLSGLKRGLTYKILDRLEELELVEKKEKAGSVTFFYPKHPDRLKELFNLKKKELEKTEETFNHSFSQFMSQFNLLEGKPNIQFYEGKSGIEKLYNDINLHKKDILLIRSPFDNDHPELEKLVNKQIKKQIENNINTRAITPVVESTADTVSIHDKERLVERRLVDRDDLMIPAQIVIYGNKIGITGYRDQLITTIIESSDITETFTKIFEFMWKNAKAPKNISSDKN